MPGSTSSGIFLAVLTLAAGFFALNVQRLVAYMRHRMSHALLSTWGSNEVRPKSMPVWMDEGLAHWLTKSIEQYRNDVDYCTGEGLGGPGK